MHRRLFCELSHYGINIGGSALAWIQDYLTDRSQSVTLDEISSCSYPASISSDIPQGTMLAPLYFIHDIPESVQCKYGFMLIVEINSPDDSIHLQTDINNLFCWSEKWQLHFNPAKCEFLT